MLHWPDDLLMLERPFTAEEKERNERETEGMYEHHLQRALWQLHRSRALPNYTPTGWHECDLYAVTDRGYAVEYEVKLTLSDFKADFRKGIKHQALKDGGGCRVPTRFFYVTPAMRVSPRDVPDYAGLIYCRWSTVNRSTRWPVPMQHIIRPAPRLNNHRVTDKTLRAMRKTAYWRFWSERFAFEDYRDNVVRGNWAANAP